MRHPRSIVITGASSGIGEALAYTYAEASRTLGLLGRNQERLAQVAEKCRAHGAAVVTQAIDVRDRAAMTEWLLQFDDESPVDLVIANAGISGGPAARGGETEEQARAIFAVNVDGVLNTIHPLLPRMQERRHGQIALMSSLAGFRGFPGAPAYSASKSAVKAYGEALRVLLRPQSVQVSVICPGFVRSRITAQNPFRMPFLMDAQGAALRIRRGLQKDRPRISFPLVTYLVIRILSLLPPALSDAIVARSPRKRPRSRTPEDQTPETKTKADPSTNQTNGTP